MDFNLDEDQLAVAELARTILDDRATTDRVRAVEATPSRVDEDLWHELGKAGLLGLALPETDGGAGLGLAALAVVLEEQGRHVAPVPLWSHAVAARAVAGHGDDALRAELLPAAADGSTRLTLALEEYDARPPAQPACRADRDADGWTLTGVKAAVPSYAGADHVLVSATGPDGPALFVLPREGAGTTWHASVTSSHDVAGELVLDGAAARLLSAARTRWPTPCAPRRWPWPRSRSASPRERCASRRRTPPGVSSSGDRWPPSSRCSTSSPTAGSTSTPCG